MTLKYDPMGNRVWKQSIIDGNSINRNYIVDITGSLPVILCEFDPCDTTLDSRGSLKKAYIYTDSGQILSQYDCNGIDDYNKAVIVNGKYFYIHDRLGSVRLVVDVNGTVRNSYTYSPYGEMFASECNETVYNPFKFTGQWFDSEIGQYYLRARMYDPVLMRLTSIDPERGKFKQPLTLHPYLYCLNEPINHFDPSGRAGEDTGYAIAWGGSMWAAEAVIGGLAKRYAAKVFMAATAVAITKYFIADAIMQGDEQTINISFNLNTDIALFAKNKFPQPYPWNDPKNIEHKIRDWDLGMSGDPDNRNNNPKDKWKRIFLEILEFFSPGD